MAVTPNSNQLIMQPFTVIIEQDEESGWYVGQLLEMPGVMSQAATKPELLENMLDALEAYLAVQREVTFRLYEGGRYEQLPLAA